VTGCTTTAQCHRRREPLGTVTPVAIWDDAPAWELADQHRLSAQLDEWIAATWSPTITLRQWWRALAAARLTAPTWPRVYGGLSSTTVAQSTIEQALSRHGTIGPPLADDSIRVIGPALREHATAAQAERWIPAMLDGSEPWTLCGPVDRLAVEADVKVKVDYHWISVSGTVTLAPRSDAALRAIALTGASVEDANALALDLAHGERDGNTVTFRDVRMPVDSMLGQPGQGAAVFRTALPYRTRSLAGRIRRGVIMVPAGPRSGLLDRTVGDIIRERPAPPAPDVDRRTSPS
jgi:alkylation response protein AidB-like acyl-CoA dehydrogenase